MVGDGQYRALRVDATEVAGAIRSFQGVNGGPAPVLPGLPDLTSQFRELRIDTVRTHDYSGMADLDARFSATCSGSPPHPPSFLHHSPTDTTAEENDERCRAQHDPCLPGVQRRGHPERGVPHGERGGDEHRHGMR